MVAGGHDSELVSMEAIVVGTISDFAVEKFEDTVADVSSVLVVDVDGAA